MPTPTDLLKSRYTMATSGTGLDPSGNPTVPLTQEQKDTADAARRNASYVANGGSFNNAVPGQAPIVPMAGTEPAPTVAAPTAPVAPVKSPLDTATEAYYASTPKAVDPTAIREQVRQQMQAQIDSVNALYGNLTSAQTAENAKTAARVRGLNVNAGLGGSDFASASAGEADAKGNQALAAIERERAAKVSEVLGNIDARATEQIKNDTATAKQNSLDYITFLKDRQDAARTDIKSLAATGAPLEQLSTEQYKKLLDQSGYDKFTLESVYNNARTAATKIDYTYKTVGNKVIGYGVDPITQKLKTIEQDLPFTAPQASKVQVLDDGSLVFYPENVDPTKPIKDQIQVFNSGVASNKNLREVNGGLYDTQKKSWVIAPKADPSSKAGERVSQATPAIDALRDKTTGYVDPKAYSDMYQAYISTNPGQGKEFLDNFPVDIYIDPTQRNLFSKSGQ